MEKISDTLDKKMSLTIKGIAVILMLFHHCWGLPEQWFLDGVGFGQSVVGDRTIMEWVSNPSKICVSMFAFLTGWSYFYSKRQTLRYSLKKIIQLLGQYWLVLFFLFYPMAFFLNGYIPSGKDVFFNLFSIHNRAVVFSWYVYFYIASMLVLPLCVKLFSKNKFLDITAVPLLCIAGIKILNFIQIKQWYLIADLRECFYWFP